MPRDQVNRISPERAKHLERNRIAANKCRIKKKREHQAIQNSLHNETARHDSLMAELNTLREEVWTLKNTVFAHASCNDHHINQQLANMSENLVGATPNQLQIPSPSLSSPSSSDGFAVGNRKGSNAVSEDSEGQLFTDPALYETNFDGIGEFSFDRLIDMENA